MTTSQRISEQQARVFTKQAGIDPNSYVFREHMSDSNEDGYFWEATREMANYIVSVVRITSDGQVTQHTE